MHSSIIFFLKPTFWKYDINNDKDDDKNNDNVNNIIGKISDSYYTKNHITG